MWNLTQNRSKSDLNKKQNKVKQNQNVTNESAGRLYWVKKSLYACTLVISVTNSFLLMIFVRQSPICHEVITRSRKVAQVQFLVNGCVWMTTILLAPVLLAVSCCFPVVCKIPRSCHSRDSQHSNSYPRNFCRGKYTRFIIPNQFFRLLVTQVERWKWVALRYT